MSPAVKWGMAGALCAAALAAVWAWSRSDDSVEPPIGPTIEPAIETAMQPGGRPPIEPRVEAVRSHPDAKAQVVKAPGAGTSGEAAPGAGSSAGDPVVRPVPEGTTHVDGIVRDDHGVALAGHTLEIRSGGELEGTVITGDDGSFHIDGLRPGAKLLRLIGPGPGDVLAGCIGLDRCSTALATEERSLNVTLPSAGLDRMAIVVRGHGDQLFTLRIVDDLNRSLSHCHFSIYGLGADVDEMSDESGAICEHVTLKQDLDVRVTFLESLDATLASLLGGRREGRSQTPTYLPLEIHLTTARMKPDLGTLVMPRMAGFALTLTDGSNGKGLFDAGVRMQCTGGGLPPSDALGEIQADGTYSLWSGRTAGEYVLDVTAAGYRSGHQVGVLVVGDGPQPLELILERTR